MYGASRSPRLPLPPPAGAQPRLAPMRLAVVARDWLQERTSGQGRFRGSKGFAPHFPEIARLANGHGADTLLFSLWSHNADTLGDLPRNELFPRDTRHAAVILGVTRNGKEEVEVWVRLRRSPVLLHQEFARTADARAGKERLMAGLAGRIFGSSLILICGEMNLIRTQRTTRAIVDDFDVLSRLRAHGVELVLNPIHDYMRRFEMPVKRKALASGTSTVVCVWNRGLKDGSEALLPWAAYRKGETITDQIQEIELPIASQPGVRVGILDLW